MKTKRFLSVLIATVMLFSLLSGTTLTAGAEASVTAPTDTWHDYTADSFERGDGTVENPYVIKTAGQLAKLSKDVMEGNPYKDTYFVLEDNIDLEGHRWIPIGVHKWTPDETVNKPFSGSFDGKEKTVSNMYIDSALDGDYYSGLFGSISNYGATNSPVIKNLVVDDATVNYNAQNQENCISAIFAGRIGGNEAPRVQFSNITVSDSTLINTATSNYYDLQSGAFAGYLDYALVQNCHTQNITVIGGANSGGFAGLTSSSAEFENCSATGSVSGDWAIGGFAGYALNSVSFTECTADVDVTANNWNAGGFCGYATYGTLFNKCVAYGDIKSTVSTFEPRLGGFAGMLAKTYFGDLAAASSMTNCYFAGKLISAHETIKPSGLVALVEESTITDCAYDGELNTDIMGYNDETTSTALATKKLKAEICENVFDGHDIENNVCSNCGYEAYNIYVSGIQVTNVNAADVLSDGGSVKFDPDTKTLTLNNCTVTAPGLWGQTAGEEQYSAIFSNIDGLTISLTGENHLFGHDGGTGTTAGIYSAGDLTITGTGTLYATGGDGSDLISAGIRMTNGDLVIENCKVIATAQSATAYSNGIDNESGTVKIKAAYVTAKGGTVTSGVSSGIYNRAEVVLDYTNGYKWKTEENGELNTGAYDYDTSGDSVYFYIEPVPVYTATVNNGTGSGSYKAGDSVAITANAPEAGKKFNGWTGLDGLTITSGAASDTTVTFAMPANDVTVTATYADNSTSRNGSGSIRYTVIFDTNGGNKISNVRVTKNTAVTKPADPEKEGCTFEGWYTDEELTTAYDFSTKVTKNFTLYAKWAEVETDEPDGNHGASDTECGGTAADNCPSLRFSDLDTTQWYHLDTDFVIERSIFRGTTETTFEPNANMTRAMMVTVLYRAEGEPAVNRSIPFADVDMGMYYANAVIWAKQNGIVKGVSETEFAPNDNITREQIAAIMHRYAQYKGYDVSVGENTNILSYSDFDSIYEYAIGSMQWAVGSGLIKGKTESTLNPKDFATRAEIAAILHRFIEANK